MKTFYTIVYSPFSAVSQERLNLGMVMLDGQGVARIAIKIDRALSGQRNVAKRFC